MRFNVFGQRAELKADVNARWEVMRANEDRPLGQAFSYYCDNLEEQLNIGDIDFKVDEK